VNEDDGDAVALSPAALLLRLERLAPRPGVGHAGQLVVAGPVGQVPLQFPLGGHVPQSGDDAADAGVAPEVTSVDHDRDLAARTADDALGAIHHVRPLWIGVRILGPPHDVVEALA